MKLKTDCYNVQPLNHLAVHLSGYPFLIGLLNVCGVFGEYFRGAVPFASRQSPVAILSYLDRQFNNRKSYYASVSFGLSNPPSQLH